MEIDKKTIKTLSSDTRVDILKSLAERRKTLTELSKEFGLAKSTLIEHLNMLRSSNLITKNEEGRKWIYYELTRKGRSVITPKISTQFILILAIGMILMIGGIANVSYETQEAFSYPVITIEKTITRIIPGEVATAVGEETSTTGAIETIEETEDIQNKTVYETGYTDVEAINWIALIIAIIGIILITYSLVNLKKNK